MAKKNLYICDNCGAEIFVHDIESIKECSYCGNIIAVIEEKIIDIGVNKIIPFEINQTEAIDNLKNFYGITEMQGFNLEKVYLPMYLCSFNMTGVAEYKTKVGDDVVTNEICISGNIKNHLYPAQVNSEDIIGTSYIKKDKIVDYNPVITNNSVVKMDNIIHHERIYDLVASKFLYQRVEEYTNSNSITIKTTNETNKKIDLVLVPFFCFKDKNNHDKYILARKNIGLLLKREKMYNKMIILYQALAGIGLAIGTFCLFTMRSLFYWFLALFMGCLLYIKYYNIKRQKSLIHKIPGEYIVTQNERK